MITKANPIGLVLIIIVMMVQRMDAEFQWEETTIARTHAAMLAGEVTSQELVERYLQRIDQFDQSSGLNAIVVTNPKALQEASALDEHLRRTGELVGPMHGIPVIVKDNMDTAGLQTTGGSAAMAGYEPEEDAFLVRHLREAGAVVLAKSNMGEWALIPFRNVSSILGETRNAYHLDYPAPGSSGGTASAVAANFGLIGLGTDTGSSIRGPAASLGLVGLRPTLGLVSRAGIIPQHYTRDAAGPITRTVEDAARILEVIAGPDPDDPLTSTIADQRTSNYTDALVPTAIRGMRIGVLRELGNPENTDPEILALFSQAMADLAALGAEIVDPFVVPEFAELSENLWCNTFRYDLERYLAAANEPPVRTIREILDAGNHTDALRDYLQESLAIDLAPDDQQPPCTDHLTDPRRIRFREAILEAMDAADVTLLVYPSWGYPPRPLADFGGPFGNNSSRIAPHTGQPAITVPMGISGNGIPAGVQFLGRPFSESTLLAAAYAYEQKTRHRKTPEAFATSR